MTQRHSQENPYNLKASSFGSNNNSNFAESIHGIHKKTPIQATILERNLIFHGVDGGEVDRMLIPLFVGERANIHRQLRERFNLSRTLSTHKKTPNARSPRAQKGYKGLSSSDSAANHLQWKQPSSTPASNQVAAAKRARDVVH